MNLTIPELSLVVLIGPSGSGKSTFAAKHFLPTEVISSDFCRALVSDDENDMAATAAAFRVLHSIAGERLRSGRIAVVDATSVQPESRKPLIALAREHDCLVAAIVFDLPEKLCVERNRGRANRNLPSGVIHRQRDQMKRSMRGLQREGFRYLYVLDSVEAVEAATIVRQPLWVNRRDDHGPFDLVGDVHGCHDELVALLDKLGYSIAVDGEGVRHVTHPQGRRVIFVGDLVDRGPDTPGVLRLVMTMVRDGLALCVAGNHDQKLSRALRGRDVKVSHGLERSLQQLEGDPAFKAQAAEFLDGLISHYVLDEGKLVVAHAGLKEDMQGRASGRVRDFALYGETTGETDEFGFPVRLDWAQNYRGRALVVYGHVAVAEPRWLNNTANIDTGCAFGGRLTALRYPEKEVVSVPAASTYYEPTRPLAAPAPDRDDLLDVSDVLGKRFVETPLAGNVTIREENATAALEVMSRFAIDPHWLIYLPPTMSPTESTSRPGLLEHPDEAFAYYRKHGVERVVCEEKHMGSRAVLIVCRDEESAIDRFGLAPRSGIGVCYTRTGRPMFPDGEMERKLLDAVGETLTAVAFWETFNTTWVCLDCELMPWSAKAQELLVDQYAPVGLAATTSLGLAAAALSQAIGRGVDLQAMLVDVERRQAAAVKYVEAYGRYCWPVNSVYDLRVAPFQILATEGATYIEQTHQWHMQQAALLASAGAPIVAGTPFKVVDLTDDASQQDAIDWWTDLTAAGGEGMVVKPLEFIAKSGRGIQPGIKCRGPEYLRIIYGPEYDLPGNLERLRDRGTLALKRSLAQREFALGIESLRRFVAREPLYRVHECVFGVLALESEPVDPAL
ncbi:MAG TPA: polynucleotide kinase-phosphatase [Candidatus Dormibacteraeota bacterium]|jgi:protein phosphatase